MDDLDKIVGKKIIEVEKGMTWDDREVDTATLVFDDGSKLIIAALSEKGCLECDEDGSLNDYLLFDFFEDKKKEREGEK